VDICIEAGVFPFSLGTLIHNPFIMGVNSICCSFYLIVLIEFLFLPSLVGEEYKQTLYPKIIGINNRILKGSSL